MKKSVVISLSVVGAILLVTCISLSLYFALNRSGSKPGPAPLSPKDQCNKNGYIWDPVKQVCTTNQCIATVDAGTGVLTGTMVDVSGDKCVNVSGGSYVSPFARATLLQLCQKAGFQNLSSTVAGMQCTKASGCNSKPFTDNSIMDGCPYLTYQPSATSASCVPPTSAQLEYLCNTSINGCPVNTNLNANCSTSQPCYDPNKGCQPQLQTPGCRPRNEMWQWINNQCVNTTVSNTIAVTVTTATVDQIQGTFVVDNPPPNAKLQWQYLLTSADSQSWQGPVTVKDSAFTIFLTNLNLPVSSTYNLVLQLYTSVDDSPYILSYDSVTPTPVKLTAAPTIPGLVTIKPALSLDLAKQLAADVQGAISAANGNSGGSNPFVAPSSDVWNNSLQGQAGDGFLIVPCTSAYCKTSQTDGIAMLILAWPAITKLSQDQLTEIQKSCPSITDPQVSCAVYLGDTLLKDKLTEGSWLQPISSDPSVVSTYKVVAYVWSTSTGDTGIQSSSCLSQPATVVVQAPTNLYSAELCYSIQPLKPEGVPIPGNFMLYHPGSNMCSAPINSVEALGARDFSCLTTASTPTLENMQLYGCNDIGDDDSCNSAGQGCQSVFPYSAVRQPAENESLECSPLPPGTVPPCGGSQYCQMGACNCPPSVQWALCGSSSFAQIGADKAIEAGRWQTRVNNVVNFINNYGLGKVVDIQSFLNEANSSDSVRNAWNKTYGSTVCPLPNVPIPDTCDVTSSKACAQTNVCGAWTPVTGSTGLYKQQLYLYPTSQQQPEAGCCPSNFTYYAGCCCPSTDPDTSCADLKNCTPASNAIGPTWCKA